MDSFRRWREEQRQLQEFNRPVKAEPKTRVLKDPRTGREVVQRRDGQEWRDVKK